MRLFTIGFTKKSAEKFFELLRSSGAKRVVDVRLSNASQLAGFAKQQDLPYFLDRICGLGYVHLPILTPTREMRDGYRNGKLTWDAYARQFLDLMRERQIESAVPPQLIADGCLLCSEAKPHYCHRRLIAEYLDRHWGDITVRHLE